MILIINCGSSKTLEIKKAVSELNIETEMKEMNELPFSLEKYSGIIISGAPIMLSEEPEHLKKFVFLNEYEKPVLGICFGHQIFGLLNNSNITITNHIEREIEISFLEEDKIFDNLNSKEFMKEDHSEYISLPDNFKLLATSKKTEVEGIKHNSKLHYGVQFHPEISGEQGKTLIMNFAKMCK